MNEQAAEYAQTRGAQLIKDLESTTLDRIRAADAAAFREGLTPDQLAERIDAIIDDPARAARIAQFELADAQMESALEAAKASGLVRGKQSLLSNNHKEEDECDDNAAAGVIPLLEPFPSGDMMAPFHPGCEDDVAMVVEGEEE